MSRAARSARYQGQRGRHRHLHDLLQARQHLPLARPAAARPRLPARHPDLAGHRRARPRRRCLDPLRPGALPPRGRPGRALGREPAHGGRARHADGADGGLLVRALGGPVVPDRRRAGHERDPGQRRARSSSPTGPTSARVFQTAMAQRKLTGTVSLDDKRSSLQSLRLFGANLEAEVRLTFQTPRNLGLETVPDYRSIPIGDPLLAARAPGRRRCARAWPTTGSATSSPPSRTSRATPRRASSSAT